MSKKDYIVIANAIRGVKRHYPDEPSITETVASAIAVVLQKDNPRFDWNRFWDYIQR